MILNKLDDVILAIDSTRNMEDLTYITDTMKAAIVQGIRDVKTLFCQEAYSYFWTHEFEVTDQIIPIMRDVVKYGGN